MDLISKLGFPEYIGKPHPIKNLRDIIQLAIRVQLHLAKFLLLINQFTHFFSFQDVEKKVPDLKPKGNLINKAMRNIDISTNS